MHRCTHSAAGGTIQRLYPGLAIVRLRSRKLISVLIESPKSLCSLLRLTAASAFAPRSSAHPHCRVGFVQSTNLFLCVDRAQSVIEIKCGHSLRLYARPREAAFAGALCPGR